MGKLEKEFENIKNQHKYRVIASTLMIHENEGIYNTPLLRDKYGDSVMSVRGDDRAFLVTDEITDHSEQEEIDKVYEMCWRKLKNRVKDDKSYSTKN